MTVSQLPTSLYILFIILKIPTELEKRHFASISIQFLQISDDYIQRFLSPLLDDGRFRVLSKTLVISYPRIVTTLLCRIVTCFFVIVTQLRVVTHRHNDSPNDRSLLQIVASFVTGCERRGRQALRHEGDGQKKKRTTQAL